MTQDDILQSTKLLIQSLDTLRTEHGKILENIIHSAEASSTNQSEEEVISIRKSQDMIDLGIDEAQVIIQSVIRLQNLEAEKQNLHIQVRRLCQENAWLRDELGSTQKKLHECEQINAAYSVEIEHLKFFNDVKQIDVDNENSADQIISEINIDGHPEEDQLEQCVSDSDPVMLSSSSVSGSLTSTNGFEIPARLKTLHNLVIQYASQGRYEVAVPLCRQTIDDLEKTTGHNHPDVATMLNILALVYRDQSNFQEASALLHDALAIRETTLGSDHPAVAATLNNLAVLYSKCDRFKEAESLCKRALEIREKHLGSFHPDVAKQLNNLALICLNQDKYDDVQTYYCRAIEIYTTCLGDDDPNVIKTKNHLASAYLKQKKYRAAEQLYLNILTDARDKDLRSSRQSSTARNFDGQGSWYKTLQINAPTVTTTLKNLSLLYRKQGRYDAADVLENCAAHARKDSQAINQAFEIVKQMDH